MSFSEVLKEIVLRVDGAASAMIIGADGISVEEYTSEKLVNLEDLGAEASAMIKNISEAAETLGLGEAKEFSIISDRCGIIMRKINQDYYLALVIQPDGNYGKGRFIMRTTISKIESEF
ncbi:MAG: roadblock/LC7 domain-containing protein [Nitrospiraceae bacterium]|nr:roadblock/LC7 domain-containing protein [Nitrospiraceae bacterium]